MKNFEKTNGRSFWKRREEVYKAGKMTPLEKKIDKFLTENNIKHHRCFPIRVGNRNNKNRFRGLCSTYLPVQNIILDVPTGIEPERIYEMGRALTILYHGTKVNAMLPIDEDCPWREVKKQLKILLGI